MYESKNTFNAESYKMTLNMTMCIDEAPKVPLPDCENQNYIFISYSHKDYQKVYSDLADFYEAGVYFWYDRGLTPGKSWKEIVIKKLTDPRCVGVIFYMSKSLYTSESVFFEINCTTNDTDVSKNNEFFNISKRYFGVNLDNEQPATAIISAAYNLSTDKDKENILLKLPKLANTFSNEVTYISYNSKEHLDDIINTLEDFDNVINKEKRNSFRTKNHYVPFEYLQIGSVMNEKYHILNELGRGGMAVVYLASNLQLETLCAIKIKRVSKIPDFNLHWIKREASILAKLDHPNIPRVIDIYNDDNSGFFSFVMDYVKGISLHRIIAEQGAQCEQDVLNWAKQICSALDYLHSQEPAIIHRDIKPSNILLKEDGNITLIDFSCARTFQAELSEDEELIGTQGYAAPEQYGIIKGQSDARTDIYAFGVTLYCLLTGFTLNNHLHTVAANYNPKSGSFISNHIRQTKPKLSFAFKRIILKCTQRNPADRYQSVSELVYDLNNFKKINRSITERIKYYRYNKKQKVLANNATENHLQPLETNGMNIHQTPPIGNNSHEIPIAILSNNSEETTPLNP